MSAIAITNAMNTIVNGFFEFAMSEEVNESLDLDSKTVEKLLKLWQDKKDDIDAEMKSQVEEILPKKAKRVKKPKDAPKNPKSAYVIFCQEKRQEVKTGNPEMPAKEIMKELGKLWQETEENERAKFKVMAEDDKKRYTEEMANYVPSEEPETKEKKKKVKKSKNAPKNASGPYIFFCKDEREIVKKEMPNLNAKEIMAELGKRWKEIKDTDAAVKYKKMAEEDKKRYAEDMEKYVPNEEEETKTKKPRAKKPKDAPKNPKSAYMFYCEKNRDAIKKKNPELKGKEITAKLADEWKKIKDTKKADKYKKMNEEDKKRYEEEMENYKEKAKHVEKDEDDEDDEDEKEEEDEDEDEDEEEEKETPEDIVRFIIDNHEGKTLKKKHIVEELKKKGFVLEKDELNSIIARVQA